MEAVFGILSALGIGGLIVSGLLFAGVVWGIGSAAGWGTGASKKKALKAASQPKPYAYLDAQKGVSPENLTKVVQGFVPDEALGEAATDVLQTLDRQKLLRTDILALLRKEFDENSLTWDKFSVPVQTACDGIIANSVHIANRMQAFDSAEYLRLDRIDRAGGLEGRDTESRRLEVMRTVLSEMKELQDANDRLLLELEKLQAELNKLLGREADDSADAIAAEIRELVEDTKYYA